jgi:RNA polymerase sigma factor (TIGR02999 family)
MSDPINNLFQNDYWHIMTLARARLARERSSISTMTLVHELYLDLNDRAGLQFASREQFFAYASRAMRSLLVDLARERVARKRRAELLPLTSGRNVADSAGTPEQLVALDEALERLTRIDARLLRVGEMRLIRGMEIADIATALQVSEPTIKRDCRRIKACLHDALSGK